MENSKRKFLVDIQMDLNPNRLNKDKRRVFKN